LDRVRPHFAHALLLRAARVFALFMLTAVSPARARTTIVPDDFATIQAAIDHIVATNPYSEAETLLVRPGDYAETIQVSYALVIRGMGSHPGEEPVVKIGGLTAAGSNDGMLAQVFEGIHFSGAVEFAATGRITSFLDCRFDADLISRRFGYPEQSWVNVRRCEVSGAASISGETVYVDSSTFHGPAEFFATYDGFVTDNRVEQVRGVALTVLARRAIVLRNIVRGGSAGIFARSDDNDVVRVEDNRVENCTGNGIVVDSYAGEIGIERNTVSRCGGIGIRSEGTSVTRGNHVLDCSGIGIHLRIEERTQIVEGNVVGRCGGDGIVVNRYLYGDDLPSSIRSNTIVSCNGRGILFHNPFGGPVAKNVACFNTGAGLVVEYDPWPEDLPAKMPLELSCNDWFADNGGATSGVAVSPSDLAIDPVLCDGMNGNGSLRSDSPLLDPAACGLIGALGQGCEAPVVAIGFEIRPRVLPPAGRSRWVTAWLEPPPPFLVAEIDLATVRVNDISLPPGESTVGDRDRDGIPDVELQLDRAALERTLGAGAEATVTITGRIGRRQFSGSDVIRVPRGARPSGPWPPRERVLSIYAPSSASAGSGVRVAFTLADESPARLEVLDVAGRVIDSRDVAMSGGDEHEVDLGANGRLAQGIYFLRLRQGTNEARTRCVLVR